MKNKGRKQAFFYFATGLFIFLLSATFVAASDDIFFYYAFEEPGCRPYLMPNGRYLANYLAYAAVRSGVFRCIFFALSYAGVFWMIGRLVPRGHKAMPWLGALLLVVMPGKMYMYIFRWICCVPVYVPPMAALLVFLYILLRDFDGDAPKSRFAIPAAAVCGLFAGQSCEHTAIYGCVLSVFGIVWGKCVLKQKFRLYQLVFAVMTAAGTAVMFLNPAYRQIADESYEFGLRTMQISFEDMFFQLYRYVLPNFARGFWAVHLVIAVSLVFLVQQTDLSGRRKEVRRYVKPCCGCVAGYAAYSVFTSVQTPLVSLTQAERTGALEVGFVFLYIVSIIFLSYLVLPKNALFRVVLFQLSAGMVSGVFCFVNPVTTRCFFADYCFWVLTAVTLGSGMREKLPEKVSVLAERFLQAGFAVFSFLLTYINLANNYVLTLNVRYLREQAEQGLQNLEFIEEPYPDYTPAKEFYVIMDYFNKDTLKSKFPDDNNQYLYWCIYLKYYGIEGIDFEQYHIRTIPVDAYFL